MWQNAKARLWGWLKLCVLTAIFVATQITRIEQHGMKNN